MGEGFGNLQREEDGKQKGPDYDEVDAVQYGFAQGGEERLFGPHIQDANSIVPIVFDGFIGGDVPIRHHKCPGIPRLSFLNYLIVHLFGHASAHCPFAFQVPDIGRDPNIILKDGGRSLPHAFNNFVDDHVIPYQELGRHHRPDRLFFIHYRNESYQGHAHQLLLNVEGPCLWGKAVFNGQLLGIGLLHVIFDIHLLGGKGLGGDDLFPLKGLPHQML